MIGMVVAGDLPNKPQLDSYKPPSSAEKRYEALKGQAGQ